MRILAGIGGALVVVALAALAYFGLFSPINVQERQMGPYQFVYVQEAGRDAARISALSAALGAHLDQAGFTVRKPAHVYFPPGRGIPNQVGFLVDRAVPKEVLGADRYFRQISTQPYMVVEFPFRGPPSFSIGHFRAESAFASYRKEKGYAETNAMVIFEDDTVLFLHPVEAR